MSATFTPRIAPKLMPPAELARIACDVRADRDERALRLLDEIKLLREALAWRGSRVEPGQIGAEVTSRSAGDLEQVGRRGRA